jgi:hypothetical protein
MKTRDVGIAIAVVAALAGLWFGRLAWRAHHNLVTLHVRNMPLAEVVRSLESQTWEKIKYDKRLNAKITLNVKDAPLDSVMDLVADRAGARWQKTYAVGASGVTMSKLESALAGETKLDDAGWTNFAPPIPDIPHEVVIGGGPGPDQMAPPPEGGGPGPAPMPSGGGRIMRRLIRPGGPPGGEDVRGGGIAGPAGGQSFMILPDGTTDVWSSERIVLETDLLPQLGTNAASEATPETAKEIASAVHGRSQLYYNIAAAPFGMGGPGPGFGLHLARGGPHGGARKMGPGPGPGGGGDIVAMMTQAQQQRRLQDMSRSPEEQVERARENATNKMHFATFDGDGKSN